MADRAPFQDSAIAPAHWGVAVTPSDATVLQTTKALYIGGAGNVAVTMAGDGATVTFIAPPVGTILPIAVTKVRAATTATNIVALS